jgi:YVTN family beta-propeller protein
MFKRRFSIVVSLLVLALLTTLTSSGLAYAGAGTQPARGKVVIANRGSGTISIIDAKSGELVETYNLPTVENEPEPMYVVYSPTKNRVFVGDRANNRVVVFNARDFSVEASVPAGNGVFHMWADPQGKQLWVNNDIDNTSTVVDPNTLKVLATVPTPSDLVALGGKPHDVILGPKGEYAYVTVLGVEGANDYVVQFSTDTFQELRRAPVGKDPHVSLARQNDFLYVPSQGRNVVTVLNRETLSLVTEIGVPGAHGAGMARNGKVFYTTNLPGGGTDGLYAIDTRTNTLIGDPVDTPYPIPHNLALTPSSHKLFVTHSGASSDKVTIFATQGNDPVPVLVGEITVGMNPFGLTYVP